MLHVVKQLQSRHPGRAWARAGTLAVAMAVLALLGLALRWLA